MRPMRRFKQQVTQEECVKILQTARRGVLSVLGDEGYPYGVPINFIYDEARGCIYFHGAKEGHKIDAIRACDKATFCTWDEGYRREGEWAWNVTSVIAFGRVRPVTDEALARKELRDLGIKYYPSVEEVEEEMAKAFSRTLILELTIVHMTGKEVNES